MDLSENPSKSGLDSAKNLRLLWKPTWQYLWKSSKLMKRAELFILDSIRAKYRRISSKRDSSQGMANGPVLVNPYSSSAWTSRFLNTGWFRYVVRTTNLLQLEPTVTATWPAGTSEGRRRAAIDAFLRHRLSIWRSLTMWRILLQADMFRFWLRDNCFLGRLG